MQQILAGGALAAAAMALVSLTGCGSGDDTGNTTAGASTPASSTALPSVSPATGTTMGATCESLAGRLAFQNTSVTAVSTVAAGAVKIGGRDVAEHCLITGNMNTRVSQVDGNTYAIGFEIRMPKSWNGRFFYQANGGLDGSVATAFGTFGGGPVTGALAMGFAVISSDAGHSGSQNPLFGFDPQARIDYGYNAAATLTPMAKALIGQAYGKGPDRSYFGGCSNGGRHAMVAAARLASQYDGILAGDPGFHLPKAAVAQVYGAQQLATVSSLGTDGLPDISTALTPTEASLIATRVLAKCDALDGATDGMVHDLKACQAQFSLANDVRSCSGARDGTCLTDAQKTALGNIFTGARNSAGQSLYASFPFDAGISGANWAQWKQTMSVTRDPAALAFVFTVPPAPASTNSALKAYAFNFSMDVDAPKIFATNGIYAESPWSFMTPPDETNLSVLKSRGAKLIVYHGTSDPVFSSNDTTDWYERLTAANGGDASNFARFFPIAGMNHCSGGPTADQFDMITPLVAWVEQGKVPDSVVATARGAGNAVPNAEVSTAWNTGSTDRTRPLCAYPKTARYAGSGDINDAANFRCL
ncbi:tannase/feruloyl esterase family alpha/beta hydrolase [Cupriavidus numazuensis]|uniref:Mono(2-hydroxyethyl) terephthalate hydrolase n=1 Tax=Cupriavidus numazuensis TaxID=221992 RepID=A0ABM8TRW1_9BURK|nr:tannase/feruloyl esterase family alpha/beta hydrolase [Cupriavidus numazuensis]CAG2159013.1 Mono(2-hydroxyethyl) terephthalate hydrolase [Cupriavidus numazuensis]